MHTSLARLNRFRTANYLVRQVSSVPRSASHSPRRVLDTARFLPRLPSFFAWELCSMHRCRCCSLSFPSFFYLLVMLPPFHAIQTSIKCPVIKLKRFHNFCLSLSLVLLGLLLLPAVLFQGQHTARLWAGVLCGCIINGCLWQDSLNAPKSQPAIFHFFDWIPSSSFFFLFSLDLQCTVASRSIAGRGCYLVLGIRESQINHQGPPFISPPFFLYRFLLDLFHAPPLCAPPRWSPGSAASICPPSSV